MTDQEHDSDQGQPSTHSTGTAEPEELADSLSQMARHLQNEQEPDQVLKEIVHSAIALIPGADEASVSMVMAKRRVEPKAASSDLPLQVDRVQTEVGEGPCLDAIFEQQTVHVPDMATEERWPSFSARATQLGAASMLSVQLYVEGNNLGALNLYGRQAHGFTDDSEHIALLFASHAAVAFADARQREQLGDALESRDLIGQAKGILMERYRIDALPAFNLLARYSRNSNRRIRDVCEELVATRQLPEHGGEPQQGAAG